MRDSSKLDLTSKLINLPANHKIFYFIFKIFLIKNKENLRKTNLKLYFSSLSLSKSFLKDLIINEDFIKPLLNIELKKYNNFKENLLLLKENNLLDVFESLLKEYKSLYGGSLSLLQELILWVLGRKYKNSNEIIRFLRIEYYTAEIFSRNYKRLSMEYSFERSSIRRILEELEDISVGKEVSQYYLDLISDLTDLTKNLTSVRGSEYAVECDKIKRRCIKLGREYIESGMLIPFDWHLELSEDFKI